MERLSSGKGNWSDPTSPRSKKAAVSVIRFLEVHGPRQQRKQKQKWQLLSKPTQLRLRPQPVSQVRPAVGPQAVQTSRSWSGLSFVSILACTRDQKEVETRQRLRCPIKERRSKIVDSGKKTARTRKTRKVSFVMECFEVCFGLGKVGSQLLDVYSYLSNI